VSRWGFACAGALIVVSLRGVASDSVTPGTLILQAEDATRIVSPASRRQCEGALGGEAVMMGADEPTAARRGEIVFDVDIAEDGQYSLWLRVQWHCTCARSIQLLTSAESIASAGSVPSFSNTPLSSSHPPRTWIWVSGMKLTFKAGRQTITLIQKEHLTLVDAIALSNDPDYLPPGFRPDERTFESQQLEGDWGRLGDGRSRIFLTDSEWRHFKLDVALGLSRNASDGFPGSNGVLFCLQQAKNGYECALRRGEDGNLNVTLFRLADGKRVLLAKRAVADTENLTHALRLVRLAEEIRICLNGISVICLRDSTFDGGPLAFVADVERNEAFKDIAIRSLQAHVVHSWEETTDWTDVSGIWHPVSAFDDTKKMSPCMGMGETGAIRLAPWSISDRFGFRAQMKLEEGSGGVCFDFRDSRNYSALVLGPGDKSNGSACAVSLLESKDGASRLVWEQPVRLDPSQWHALELQVQPGSVGVHLNGSFVRTLPFTCTHSASSIGLFSGKASAVAFAEVYACDEIPADDMHYIFEPWCDDFAQAHWRHVAGTSRLVSHPAYFEIRPTESDGEILIERRAPLSGDFVAEVFLQRDEAVVRANTLGGQEDVPLARLPVLPGGARFGLRIRDHSDPSVELIISADRGGMGDLRIDRNGDTLAQESASSANISTHPSLMVSIRGNRIVASIDELVEASTEFEAMEAPRNWEIALWGEHMDPVHPLNITEIRLRNLSCLSGWDSAEIERDIL